VPFKEINEADTLCRRAAFQSKANGIGQPSISHGIFHIIYIKHERFMRQSEILTKGRLPLDYESRKLRLGIRLRRLGTPWRAYDLREILHADSGAQQSHHVIENLKVTCHRILEMIQGIDCSR
jgi:hypothetical protein